MTDNSTEVNLNFKATGLSDLDRAKEGLKNYKEEAEKAKTAGNAAAQALNESLAKLQQQTVTKELAKQFGEAAAKTGDTATAVKGLTVELEKLGASEKEILAAGKAFETAKEQALALADATAKAEVRSRELAKANEEAAAKASEAAEVQSGTGGGSRFGVEGLRRTGGALTQLAGSEAGAPIQRLGDIGQVAKELGILSSSAGELKSKALEAAQAIGYGNIGMVAGIAAATVAIKIFTDQAEKARAAAQAEIDARQKAIGLLATGTKEAEQARINELNNERIKNKAIADDANKTLAVLRQQIDATGKSNLALAEFNANMGTGAGELKAAKEAAEKANKALQGTSTELDILQQGSGLTAQTTADLAKAEKDLADARAQGGRFIRLIEDPLDKAKEISDFLATATTKDLEAKKKQAQAESELDSQKIVQLIGVRNKLDESSQAYKDLDAEIDRLREKNDLQVQGIVALNDATSTAAAKENDLKVVRENQIATTAKYVDATKKLEEDKQQALVDSARKYGDTLVNIADAAAKSADEALRKVKEKRDDLATSFAQGETDTVKKAQYQQIDNEAKFRRDDAKAARDHANELLKIQKDQYDKEQDLVLNRDFAGLYALQRDKNKQLEAANTAYDNERQNRIDAYSQQEEDQQEAFKREEEQRQLNYKRQQDAAQLAYNREQQALERNTREAYNKALQAATNEQNLLNQKYVAQQTMLNSSVTQQLQLQAQGEQAKLRLESDYYTKSQQLIRGIYSNGGSTSTGSGSSAGFGSGTYGTSGFLPQGANVGSSSNVNNNNSKTVVFSNSQSITGGGDAAALAGLVAQMVQQKIAEMLR